MRDQRPQLVRGYTIALAIATALVLNSAFWMFWLAQQPQHQDDDGFLLLLGRATLALAIVLGAVTLLRFFDSRLARGATLALNALLVFHVPLGTLAFLYWLLVVRRRERIAPGHSPLPNEQGIRRHL